MLEKKKQSFSVFKKGFCVNDRKNRKFEHGQAEKLCKPLK
jgi:hypothetical protein